MLDVILPELGSVVFTWKHVAERVYHTKEKSYTEEYQFPNRMEKDPS